MFKTKTTMKKTYINPTMVAVELQYNNHLLAGSGGVADGGTPGEAYSSGDVSYSRGYDFDDEEDW